MDEIEFGTVEQACRIVGGDERPINAATYYRGARDGRYTKPIKVSPNISRVDLGDLRRRLRAQLEAATGAGA